VEDNNTLLQIILHNSLNKTLASNLNKIMDKLQAIITDKDPTITTGKDLIIAMAMAHITITVMVLNNTLNNNLTTPIWE